MTQNCGCLIECNKLVNIHQCNFRVKTKQFQNEFLNNSALLNELNSNLKLYFFEQFQNEVLNNSALLNELN